MQGTHFKKKKQTYTTIIYIRNTRNETLMAIFKNPILFINSSHGAHLSNKCGVPGLPASRICIDTSTLGDFITAKAKHIKSKPQIVEHTSYRKN